MAYIDPSKYTSTNDNDEIWVPEGYEPTHDDIDFIRKMEANIERFRKGCPTNDAVEFFIKNLYCQINLEKVWLGDGKHDDITQIIEKNVFEPILYEYITSDLLNSMIRSIDRVIVKLEVMYNKHLISH